MDAPHGTAWPGELRAAGAERVEGGAEPTTKLRQRVVPAKSQGAPAETGPREPRPEDALDIQYRLDEPIENRASGYQRECFTTERRRKEDLLHQCHIFATPNDGTERKPVGHSLTECCKVRRNTVEALRSTYMYAKACDRLIEYQQCPGGPR